MMPSQEQLAAWRTELESLKQCAAPGREVDRVLALHRALRHAAGQNTLTLPTHAEAEKARLVAEAMRVKPFVLPEACPPELGDTVQAWAERTWSLEFYTGALRKLESLTSTIEENTRRIEEINSRMVQERRQYEMLSLYCRVLDELAGNPQQSSAKETDDELDG